jgi:hypothetical protein
MKTTIASFSGLLILLLCAGFLFPVRSFRSEAGALTGAWELIENGEGPFPQTRGQKAILSCSDTYWTLTYYNMETKVFDFTTGGTYRLEDHLLSASTEFHSSDSNQVGISWSLDVDFSGEEQVSFISNAGEEQVRETYKRIDDAGTDLAGNWNFHARKQGEELSVRTPGPRKTIKLLTGTRFQWAAINTETKQFFGTGGGTYTFEDGKYTEHIEFFSRDSSRVGASLSFDGRVEGDDWHHSGKSSKGDPMYEIWRRE